MIVSFLTQIGLLSVAAVAVVLAVFLILCGRLIGADRRGADALRRDPGLSAAARLGIRPVPPRNVIQGTVEREAIER